MNFYSLSVTILTYKFVENIIACAQYFYTVVFLYCIFISLLGKFFCRNHNNWCILAASVCAWRMS